MLKAVIVNYNFDPQDWWLDYGYKPEEVLLYDRSDDGIERSFSATVKKTANVGNVDYDKLNHLVENYEKLPSTFLWIKSNLWKYITPEEYEKVANNKDFTPLLTQNHRTYSDEKGLVCFYEDGMYHERNQLVYATNLSAKNFNFYADFAKEFDLPNPDYLPFPPGGNFILTKETVHKHPKEYYAKMASILPYTQLPL